MRLNRLLVVAALALAGLAWASPALAAGDPGQQLAEKYAPVLQLVDQPKACGPGEPYVPMNIDRILGNTEVVLRGPWDSTTTVKIAPTADDLLHANYGYHLDFPGSALDPGCTYEQFSRRAVGHSQPTTYAHIATQPDRPGKLSLQYWFFYAYNDFNNKHEGDWEMIQLDFDADNAAQALTAPPTEIGYSQHEGAEKADWGAAKLQLIDGTHPVVYPAAGSHANYFDAALWLGRTAQQGVGCDNTRAPHRQVDPAVAYVPPSEAAYVAQYPWLGYLGAWGEKQSWVFNGPTGPNQKYQWTRPISWSDDWRSSSTKIPTSSVRIGNDPAAFFCTVVGTSSTAFTLWEQNRDTVLFVLSALVTLLLWLLSRTSWQPSAPLHLARKRGFGQIVFATGRLYRRAPMVFVHLTALLVPIPILIAVSTILIDRVDSAETLLGAIGAIAALIAVVLDVLVLCLVQVVVALAMERVDAGRPVTFMELFLATRAVAWTAIRAWLLYIVIAALLAFTFVGIPIAIYLAVRWAVAQQAIALEGAGVRESFRRSGRLVRGNWIKTGIVSLLGAALPELLGPLAGALIIFALGVDFVLANLLGTLAFLCLLPFGAAMRTYLYHDLRVRDVERAPELETGGVLPAELPGRALPEM